MTRRPWRTAPQGGGPARRGLACVHAAILAAALERVGADGHCGLMPEVWGDGRQRRRRCARSAATRRTSGPPRRSATSAAQPGRQGVAGPRPAPASSRGARAWDRSSSRHASGSTAVDATSGREVALVQERPREAPQRGALPPALAPRGGCRASMASSRSIVPAREPLRQPLLPGTRRRATSVSASSATRNPGEHAALERPLLEDRGAQRVDGGDRRALQDLEGLRRRARAPTRGARPSARARSRRSRSRSFIVVAAFSVKVTAAISSRRAPPLRTRASMRSTRSVVLPVPAPASMTKPVA